MATILIVDDDAAILMLLTTVLHDEAGHTIVAASNGRQALDVLRSEPIDAVVCDVNMPVMNGIELVRAIRADNVLKEMPVVMISAMVHPEDLEPNIDVDRMLKKPFDLNVLTASVSSVLGRARAGHSSLRANGRKASTSLNRMLRAG